MDEVLLLEDWFPSDPPDDDHNWISYVEDPCSPSNSMADQLYSAIETGNLEEVQDLLNKGVSPNSYEGTTPLLAVASHCGAAAIVRALLKASANPNLEDDARQTSLIFAARTGHFEIVKDLIDAGANTCIKEALLRAFLAGQGKIFKYLLDFISDKDYWLYSSEESLKNGYPDWCDLLFMQNHV